MKKLMAMILMFGLVFGTPMMAKAADFDIHIGGPQAFRVYPDGHFTQWDARQRDRLQDAYRDGMINHRQYNRLAGELSNVEAFHNQAASDGWISPGDQRHLERMEARMNAHIEREVSGGF